jgi:cysteine desulfurase
LLAQIHGGGHQNNFRSGTINVAGIVGLAKACEIAQRDYWDMNTHISKLKNYFEHQLLDIEGLTINGSTRYRLYTTSNITFPKNCDVKKLLTQFAFSSGSACASNSVEPSHVLTAMNIHSDEIKNSFRFSFSKYNTLEEVQLLIEGIKKVTV